MLVQVLPSTLVRPDGYHRRLHETIRRNRFKYMYIPYSAHLDRTIQFVKHEDDPPVVNANLGILYHALGIDHFDTLCDYLMPFCNTLALREGRRIEAARLAVQVRCDGRPPTADGNDPHLSLCAPLFGGRSLPAGSVLYTPRGAPRPQLAWESDHLVLHAAYFLE